MNRFFSSKLLGLSGLLLACSLGAPAPAQAQMAVAVVTCMAVPGAPCATTQGQASIVSAVGSTTAAVGTGNGLLQTQNLYLTQGLGGGPGGVIALLSGINERLGMVTNANNQAVENEDMAARQRIYDQSMMDVRGSRIPTPSKVMRACIQATAAGGRAAAAQNSHQRSKEIGGSAASPYSDARPEVQSLVDTAINRKELGVCTEVDVANNRPGCVGAGVGDRPTADMRSDSLFDGGVDPKQSTQSIDARGVEIGKQFITNVAPLAPSKPATKEQQESQGGVAYMLTYNRYTARVSTATDALSQILGFGAQMAPGTAAPYMKSWSADSAKYKEIFGVDQPAMPSERDLLRFDVMKNYASVQDAEEMGGYSADDIAKKQLELSALNARLNFEVLMRLERQNALLAAMVSQQMDPLTSSSMSSSLSNLGNQRASAQQK